MNEVTEEPQSSSVETTPGQLDAAEREGVEPFELEFATKLFSVGGRGHHIQRERRKTMHKEPTHVGHGSSVYITENPFLRVSVVTHVTVRGVHVITI